LWLAISVVAGQAASPAAAGPALLAGHLRAGVNGSQAGAMALLGRAPGLPSVLRTGVGQAVEFNVTTEAVFFGMGHGEAVFDLQVFGLNAGGSRQLLQSDQAVVTQDGPGRQPGTLWARVSFDTAGEYPVVIRASASAQAGGSAPVVDTDEVTLTVAVAAGAGLNIQRSPVGQACSLPFVCDGDQDSAQKSRAASPTYNSATMPEADSAAEPTPATTQLAPLAFPRVHVFADGRAAADTLPAGEVAELTLQQGRRSRVEIQPEGVWYDGAEKASFSAVLDVALINTDGARIPFGRAVGQWAGTGPAVDQTPLFVNLQFSNPGTYQLVATVSVTGPNGAVDQDEIRLPVKVEAPPPGTTGFIGGRVVAEDTGRPLADVPVIARAADGSGPARQTLTRADGRYLIEVLWTGQYLVQVPHQLPRSHSDYVGEFYQDAEDSASATPVTVRAGRTTKGIDFALSPIGSISGVIIAADTGAPVRSALISAGLPGNSYTIALGRANEDGTYVVGPLSPGLYWVRVSPGNDPPGLVGTYYNGVSTLAEATLVSVEARRQTKGIDFVLASRGVVPGHGNIAGRVSVELQPGETELRPFEGMRVVAIGQGISDWGEADTGPDGSFRIDALPVGSYKVYARDPQRLGIVEFYNHVLDVNEATPVRVTEGETASGIDFSLPPRPTDPTGAIAGRVMVANQAGVVRKPLQTLTVWAEPVNPSGRPWRRYGLTDSSGNYQIELLEPGIYFLHVVDGPGLFATQYFDHAATPEEATPVIVTGGRTASGIDFDLLIDTRAPQLGSISGRITAEPPPGETQQVPLAGMVVEAFEQYGHKMTFWTMTGADGTYHLDHLLFGPYYVRALDPNGVYMTEYYSKWNDNAVTPYQASDVSVTRGGATTGIDIALAPVSGAP